MPALMNPTSEERLGILKRAIRSRRCEKTNRVQDLGNQVSIYQAPRCGWLEIAQKQRRWIGGSTCDLLLDICRTDQEEEQIPQFSKHAAGGHGVEGKEDEVGRQGGGQSPRISKWVVQPLRQL